MALLASNNPTLVDVANMPGNEMVADVINLMAQFNPILGDAVALPCNKGVYHETSIRTGLPAPTWGRLYKGVPTSKGQTQMVKDTTGFLESAAEVDQRIVDDIETAMGKASIRAEEAEGHLEAMAQEMAKAIFYHDSSTDPEKPTGFAPRFNDFSAENARQLVDGGGTGTDNTSIWFITWDKKASHLLYPNKGKAGIERINRGLVPKLDANGDTYFVYREDFKWHLGVTVRDWRYVVRICNVDVSDLTVDAATGANLINLMTEAYYRHYGRRTAVGKTYIYAHTVIVKYLDYQARNTPKNLFLTFDKAGVNASEVLQFRGIAIRESDALLLTEARVV